MRTSRRLLRLFAPLAALAAAWVGPAMAVPPGSSADHFERRVRPLLLNRCVKCHGPQKVKGGLRLDSAAGLSQGGVSGPAVVPGKPTESRLIEAVRQTGDLKMPPGGKLKDGEVADLVAWVAAGAVWPGSAAQPAAATTATVQARAPNDGPLAANLQAWFRADDLALPDGAPVHIWPDASGRGHDLAETVGVRPGGVGQPPTLVAAGGVNRRPAVRFRPECGLAGSPHHPLDITGDAALTIFLVVNLQPNNQPPPFDGVLGIGDPANPGHDPGRPLAALVQIRRTADAELTLAGGWNHDATLGPGSFRPLYGRPVLLAVVKTPGPMRTTTRCFIDGTPSTEGALRRQVGGTDAVPAIRHRADIGLCMGKALPWCGGFRGDVSEVVVYNRALADAERSAVETSLAAKYAIVLPEMVRRTTAHFRPAQKQFWAFRPVVDAEPPAVRDGAWARSPIDRFVLAKLETKDLRPAPPADRRTLLRRVTFDLTGLPPTPAEIDAFLADRSPDAFARVVDRLLASPAYGERWGRHWLDVARYAESTANDANAVMRYAWRYRDYVVAAYNHDKPYDRFVTEQLAGDLLPAGDSRTRAERVIATGFLMVGPKALAETDKEQTRIDIVDDQIDVTGRAFLGLTLGCARCHDHKFDPVPTVDYYSLAGIFRGTEPLLNENRNASMWQEWELPGPDGKPMVVMAPREGRPINLRVHLRGNRFTLGAVAPRRFLQVVAGEGNPPLRTAQSGRLELARWVASKGNPLTARVMVNRVWQNHFGTGLVATSDNFGVRGERPSHPELLDWLATEFVRSDWSVKALHRTILLSATYQQASTGAGPAAGQSADPDNRLLGRAPRRRLDAEALRDALLAVSGRLDRAVGGNASSEYLWNKAEGLGNGIQIKPNRLQTDDPYYTTCTRRSLYLPMVRNLLPDVLTLFDAADPNGVTAVRNDTTVPSQALFMLNHPFVREQALHFARSLLGEAGDDARRVRSAHLRALGRPPTAEEAAEALAYLRAYQDRAHKPRRPEADLRLAAWQSYCQLLFCSNEFMYVD